MVRDVFAARQGRLLRAVRVAGIAALALPGTLANRAQSRPASDAFEVASVKPNHSSDDRMMIQFPPGGRVVCTNATAKGLIMMAYNLKADQLAGGPNWLGSERYDVTAKAAGLADPEQLKNMMRTLLVDRFKLEFHHDAKQMAVYNLVAAKNGPKLRAARAGSGQRPFRIGRGVLDLPGTSLAQFAYNLSNVVGRHVVDRTGLAGTYDIKLEWTPDMGESLMPGPSESAAAASEASWPSLFPALEEQLGLQLVSAKGPVEIMVIDRIERASAN